MYRYYVSFAYQGTAGLGIGAMDIAMAARIVSADDVKRISDYITQRGYTTVKVLGFSPYAEGVR